jgi:hypothetical protein
MRPPLSESDFDDLERVALWLDARFVVPGLGFRFGLDGLIGLLPGVGDAATALPALWLVSEMWARGVPGRLLLRMLVNLGLDLGIGAVPFVGDVFDVAFKANLANVKLAKDWARAEAARGAGRLTP